MSINQHNNKLRMVPPAVRALDEHMLVNTKPTVFIALPNLLWEVTGLCRRLFEYAANSDYRIQIKWLPENRHHDFARNVLVADFLQSRCDWLLFIDSDVEPPPDLLDMTRLGKKIIAANVLCWMKHQIMPSIWTLAECHECEARKRFLATGEIHDPTQYKLSESGEFLMRWNPFSSDWNLLVSSSGEERTPCRCNGTSRDPWVYRVHPDVFTLGKPCRVASVGAAALMIHREVIEKMEPPWFRFLYKESGEILLTEDHFFCWRAREAGFEVWADPAKICRHFKTMDLFEVNKFAIEVYERGLQEGVRQAEAMAAPVPVPEPLPDPVPAAE